MKRALTVLAVFCVCAYASPAGASDDESGMPRAFDPIAGKKLVSVDGSTITLSQSEGGLDVAIVSPSGAERDLTLSFLGDGIGTISDGGAKAAAGVFHQMGAGLEADFADGHTESFTLNSAGGISMVLNGSDSNSYCMRWYPDGHVFDAADRKAALAAYANRLGLADQAAQKSVSGCTEAPVPVPVATKPRTAPTKHHAPSSTIQDASVTQTQPIAVRTSEVHLIDTPQAMVQEAPLVAQPAHVTPQVQPLPRPEPQLASTRPDKVRGASTCLSIDSDGAGWGFRNGCGYAVQFAYCLKNGDDKSVACGSGSGSGNVAPNGFASVLPNDAIVTAEQEFRWIACAGGADQVAARLDRPDPPAGRCVPVRAL